MVDKPISLTALRDIHLPTPIEHWPWAPGWYILLGGVLIAISLSCCVLHRRHTQKRTVRAALQQLHRYQIEYQQNGDVQTTTTLISELLRRVALAYYPRHQVAGLAENAWLDFLNANAKRVDFHTVRQALLEMPYQALKTPHSKSTADLTPLFDQTRRWLKQQGSS